MLAVLHHWHRNSHSHTYCSIWQKALVQQNAIYAPTRHPVHPSTTSSHRWWSCGAIDACPGSEQRGRGPRRFIARQLLASPRSKQLLTRAPPSVRSSANELGPSVRLPIYRRIHGVTARTIVIYHYRLDRAALLDRERESLAPATPAHLSHCIPARIWSLPNKPVTEKSQAQLSPPPGAVCLSVFSRPDPRPPPTVYYDCSAALGPHKC